VKLPLPEGWKTKLGLTAIQIQAQISILHLVRHVCGRPVIFQVAEPIDAVVRHVSFAQITFFHKSEFLYGHN